MGNKESTLPGLMVASYMYYNNIITSKIILRVHVVGLTQWLLTQCFDLIMFYKNNVVGMHACKYKLCLSKQGM